MKLPAVRRGGRGIKAELRRSPNPPSLYRASARFTLPFIPAAPQAGSPLRSDKQQGIQAKANKTRGY